MDHRFRVFRSAHDLLEKVPAGSRKILKIGDRKVCLFHYRSVFYAFDHLCPHNKFPLFEGRINYLEEIVCPLHGYRFDLKNGRESRHRCSDLKIHRLEITDEGVFLTLFP